MSVRRVHKHPKNRKTRPAVKSRLLNRLKTSRRAYQNWSQNRPKTSRRTVRSVEANFRFGIQRRFPAELDPAAFHRAVKGTARTEA